MKEIVKIYSVSPQILALQLEVGNIQRGIGIEPDIFFGRPIDENHLFDSQNYSISSATDSDFQQPINLDRGKIYIKTKTTDVALLNKNRLSLEESLDWTQQYDVFLKLPDDLILKPQNTYTIDFLGNLDPKIVDIEDFDYIPETIFSEAIHVSQLGFDPDDPKLAFLSLWMGQDKDGTAAPTPENFKGGLQFWIVDAKTGLRVGDQGIVRRAKLSSTAMADEDFREGVQNYAATDVLTLDFSDFNQPGDYFIQVDGVGRSFEFEIAENTWEKAFQVSMQGLYNQRSGTAIGGPYSKTEYPRSFHPDDGVFVFPADDISRTIAGEAVQVDGVSLIDLKLDGIGFIKAFEEYTRPFDGNNDAEVTISELAKYITPLENAWGGYKDAGDWDRRIQHLFGTLQHLELLELFPEYFETIDLNIPDRLQSFPDLESLNSTNYDNGLPDLLDESLWNLDFFRRLQNEDGGVRGGIESSSFPRPGETSWEESQTVFAFAPDPWSSYIYAGTAARAARVLGKYDPKLANRYAQSAVRAMNWAEKEVAGNPKYEANTVKDRRNLAALELYLLTEDPDWHDVFLEDTVFRGKQCQPGQTCNEVFEFEVHDSREAAFLYARAPQRLTKANVRKNAIDAILRAASYSLTAQNGGRVSWNGEQYHSDGTAFKWTKSKSPNSPLNPGSLSVPQVEFLLQAYAITGEQNYLEAAVLGSQFSAGANPSNTVFTTGLVEAGLAKREPINPFVIDARYSGQDAPAGITTYGPVAPQLRFGQFQAELFGPDTYPTPEQWPTAEAYFDNYWNFRNSEFTVFQTIAPTAYTWGFLAASDFKESRVGLNDLLKGTIGADNLKGFAGKDTLFGGKGPDRLEGGTGNDVIAGGEGGDRLLGNSGNDWLKGHRGPDSLDGGAGNDVLIGGEGNDKLFGSEGNDILAGQQGNDTLTGARGRDIFKLDRWNSRDVIRDFEDGVDRIQLTGGLSFDRVTLRQVGRNVLVVGGRNNQIAILTGVDAEVLSAVDFV